MSADRLVVGLDSEKRHCKYSEFVVVDRLGIPGGCVRSYQKSFHSSPDQEVQIVDKLRGSGRAVH